MSQSFFAPMWAHQPHLPVLKKTSRSSKGGTEPQIAQRHSTPLNWLRAAGAGLVVLDARSWEARQILRDAHDIVCESEPLARAVRDLTRQRVVQDYPAIGYMDQGP